MKQSAKLEQLLWVYFSREWFNATQLALLFDKNIGDYISKPDTLEYIAIACKRNNIADLNSLIVHKEDAVWMSPLLIANYGYWLDTDFSIWQNEMVAEMLNKGVINYNPLR